MGDGLLVLHNVLPRLLLNCLIVELVKDLCSLGERELGNHLYCKARDGDSSKERLKILSFSAIHVRIFPATLELVVAIGVFLFQAHRALHDIIH